MTGRFREVLLYKYKGNGFTYTHTQGMLNNLTALCMDHGHGASVVGGRVMKKGNIVPRAGFEPTSLAFVVQHYTT